jgi:hypothetical protein
MLRIFAVLLTATGAALCAESSDQGPLLAVQQLFDAMRTHDGTAVRSLFVPGAMLFSIRQDGTPDTTPFGQFADHVGSGKGVWLERIWNPKVMEHDSVAAVWAEYDFHLNGNFSHCGIDSFSLIKTSAGWKITSVSDTRQKSGCTPSPLGPPAK